MIVYRDAPNSCPWCDADMSYSTEITRVDEASDVGEWMCGLCGHTWRVARTERRQRDA